jgi:hypothetical protein
MQAAISVCWIRERIRDPPPRGRTLVSRKRASDALCNLQPSSGGDPPIWARTRLGRGRFIYDAIYIKRIDQGNIRRRRRSRRSVSSESEEEGSSADPEGEGGEDEVALVEVAG